MDLYLTMASSALKTGTSEVPCREPTVSSTGAGTPIVTKELTANILDSGISRNGKLAYCETANSKTEHSYKIFLFDLETGAELLPLHPVLEVLKPIGSMRTENY